MRNWKRCAAPVLLAAAGAAMGQNLDAYSVLNGTFEEDLSMAPAIAVGQSTVVIAGTHTLRLYNKSLPVGTPATSPGFLLDLENWAPAHPSVGYPFWPRELPGSPNSMSLVFPRAEYDPISGRTWMMFSEVGGLEGLLSEPTGGFICAPHLHLAVNRAENGAFTSFSNTEWYYYTGSPTNPGNGGDAFNLGSTALVPYQGNPSHQRLMGNAMVPTLGFDDRAIFVTASDNASCAAPLTSGIDPAIFVIPRKHDSGTKSILAGDPPDESDLLVVRIGALPETDGANTLLAVQEPYEQYPNMQLFISTDGTTSAGGIMQGIRLRGIYNAQPDPTLTAGPWLMRQSLKLNSAGTDVVLADMDISTSLPQFRVGPPQLGNPTQFPEAPGAFGPYVDSDAFMSAVLTEDNQGNPRVFAVHASLDAAPGGSGWVVQWYVIDPKIPDFFTTSPAQDTNWNPQIVAIGRIETDGAAQPADGDCYLPVLGVTRSGQVYIQYTFSNSTTYPKIMRAILNNSYSGVASTVVAQSGPAAPYGSQLDLWGLYGDMQADPTGCAFWSTHTLVDTASSRSAWLIKTPFNCFQTDLNADGSTDPFDLVLYQNLFHDGARRADTDADGEVDLTDMATFINAYDAATGP